MDCGGYDVPNPNMLMVGLEVVVEVKGVLERCWWSGLYLGSFMMVVYETRSEEYSGCEAIYTRA